MKIMNIMLSRDLGGIQQVFLDYDKMLKLHDINVVNITSTNALINSKIQSDYKLPNLGNWDWLSVLYLKIIILLTKPDIIIAHGGRATKFAFYSKANNISLVSIIHSGKLKWVEKADYIIALTKYMYQKAYNEGTPSSRLLILPNAIDTNIRKYEPIGQVTLEKKYIPTIGTMARFVPKKAIDVFIKSMVLLKTKGIEFNAIIGGSGTEEKALKALVDKYKLNDHIKFLGWVQNKKEFFDQIDIFCHPSIEEPFGVMILEAMLFDKPIIAADADGPAEIISHMKDGIIVPRSSPSDMADAIEELIENSTLRNSLTDKAFLTVRKHYDITVVGKKLVNFLNKIYINDSKNHQTQNRSYDSHI